MMELFCSTETAKVPFRAHPEFEIWKLLHLLILKFIVFECNQMLNAGVSILQIQNKQAENGL